METERSPHTLLARAYLSTPSGRSAFSAVSAVQLSVAPLDIGIRGM